jgi:hypothetical protein
LDRRLRLQTHCRRGMRAAVAQGGLISPFPPRGDSSVRGRRGHHSHVPQASSPYQLPGIVSQRSRAMAEWRIAINISKSTAMLFTRRRIQKLLPVQLFGELILWVDASRYLGAILDTRMTWSSHIDQIRKKAAQRLGPLLHRSGLQRTASCFTSSSSVP